MRERHKWYQSKRNSLRDSFVKYKRNLQLNWLDVASSRSIRNAINNANLVIDNHHFKIKFRSKKDLKQSYQDEISTNRYFQIKENGFKLSKVAGNITTKCKLPFKPQSKAKNIRITLDKQGRYWVSLAVEIDVKTKHQNTTTDHIGIDLGVKNLIVTSDNEYFNRVNVSRFEKRLKRFQRKSAKHYILMRNNKTKIKSKRLLKLEYKIRQLYEKITNITDNNIHKITSTLIKRNPKTIVVEDFKVSELIKRNKHNHKFVNILNKCKFYEILWQLKYKCEMNDIKFIVANKWYPSSKLCSNCGSKKIKLSLSTRLYKCEYCEFEIDRDLNAALNLKKLALI